MRAVACLATVALAAVVPAGANRGARGTSREPARVATSHTVEIRDFAFLPAHLDVLEGDTIVWINRDAAPHTATDAAGRWDSGELVSGERWSRVGVEVGRFGYVCDYHPSMKGTINVTSIEAPARGPDRISGLTERGRG